MTYRQFRMLACSVRVLGSYTWFSQKTDIHEKGVDVGGGICHGLAMEWLMEKRDLNTFATTRMRSMANDKARMARVLRFHSLVPSADFGAFRDEMRKWGFQVDINDRMEGLTPADYGKVAKTVQAGALGSYWLMYTQRHTMALVCRGLTIYFFDGNAGEVVVTGPLALEAFFKSYLYDDDRYMMSSFTLLRLRLRLS